MGEKLESVGCALINTPMMNADMLSAKKELVEVVKATGYFNSDGVPLHLINSTIEANGNITFSFDNKPLGSFYNPKDGDHMDKVKAVATAKDPSKVFALTGEAGSRLEVSVFDALEVKRAKGEEVTASDLANLGSVENARKKLLDGGSPLSEGELDERIAHMKNNGVSEKNIKYVLSRELSEVKTAGDIVPRPQMPFKEPAASPDKFGNITEAGLLDRAISSLRMMQHIILDGPKGTGKDVMLETISWLTCRPFISHTMTMDVTKEDLLGDYITDNNPISFEKHQPALSFLGNIEAGIKGLFTKQRGEAEDTINLLAEVFKPRVVFEPSSVVTALHAGRCILNLDEMNLANTGVLSGIVNTITDNHSTYIYVRGAGKVAITGQTWVTATMNGLDCDYEGTQALNEATDDRFKTIRFNTPSGSVFDILMGLNTGADTTQLKLVDDVFQAIRDIYVNGYNGVAGAITSKAVSMRACRRMLMDLADGITPYEAFRDNFLNKLSEDDADTIYEVVVTKGIIRVPAQPKTPDVTYTV